LQKVDPAKFILQGGLATGIQK